MSKGAKPGQNRFAGSQKRNREFRICRIKDEVVPRLKTFVGKTSFDGITPFSRFCAELYNADLPVNEKKIGYRTLVQSTAYWALIGPLFHRYWDSDSNMESAKNKLVEKLSARRADGLQAETERLKKEIEALKSALRTHGATLAPISDSKHSDQAFMTKFDKTCRALRLVLKASDGMFVVDMKAGKITCTFDDLEPAEGLVPRDIAEPFVLWMKAKESKNGDQ